MWRNYGTARKEGDVDIFKTKIIKTHPNNFLTGIVFISLSLAFQTLLAGEADSFNYSASVDISTKHEQISSSSIALNSYRYYHHYDVAVDQNMNLLNMGYGTSMELVTGTHSYNATYGYTNFIKTTSWDINLQDIIITKFGMENGTPLNGLPFKGNIDDIPEASIATLDNFSKTINHTTHSISKGYTFNLEVTTSLADWAKSGIGSVFRGIIFDYSEVHEVSITPNINSFLITSVDSGQKNGWDFPIQISQTESSHSFPIEKVTDCNGKSGFFIVAPFIPGRNNTKVFSYDIRLDDTNPINRTILKNYQPVFTWKIASHSPLSFNTPPPPKGISIIDYSKSVTDEINRKLLAGFTSLSTELDQCTPMNPNENWANIDNPDHVRWWISAKLEKEGSHNGNLAFYSHNNLDDGLFTEIFTIEELVAFSEKINMSPTSSNIIIVDTVLIPDLRYSGMVRNAHTFSNVDGRFTILDTKLNTNVLLHEYFHTNHGLIHRPARTSGANRALLNSLSIHGNELNAFEWIKIGESDFARN